MNSPINKFSLNLLNLDVHGLIGLEPVVVLSCMMATFLFLLFAHLLGFLCTIRATEGDFTRTSVAILKELMNVDPPLGVQYIRQKQEDSENSFQDRIIPFIPQLLRMGAWDVLHQIPKTYWSDLATKRRWRRIRNRLLLMFAGKLVTNLKMQFQFINETGERSAESLPKLLEIWVQEQPYTHAYRLGALGSIPFELTIHILNERLSIAEELALAQTCHWLNDFLMPSIRDKYKECNFRSGRRKFQFSIRKIYKLWVHQEPESDSATGLKNFLLKMKSFKCFESCLIEGRKEEWHKNEQNAELKMEGNAKKELEKKRNQELERPSGFCCLFDYLIHAHFNSDLVILLIKQYPVKVLENFEVKYFVSAWFLDYPDRVLEAVIKNAENVPSDVLYVVSDRRFSDKLLKAVLERFKWRLTVQECNYMMTRLRTKGMLEKVLDTLPNGFYNFCPMQLKYFLKMDLDNGRIERLLQHFKVCLSEGGKLLEDLLKRRLRPEAIVCTIQNNAQTLVIGASTVELAIKLECDDKILSALINLAQKKPYHEPRRQVTEEESSEDDLLLRIRTFGSGVLDIVS